jgi:hypothetical protein
MIEKKFCCHSVNRKCTNGPQVFHIACEIARDAFRETPRRRRRATESDSAEAAPSRPRDTPMGRAADRRPPQRARIVSVEADAIGRARVLLTLLCAHTTL